MPLSDADRALIVAALSPPLHLLDEHPANRVAKQAFELPPIVLTVEKHQAGKHDQSTHGRGGRRAGGTLLPVVADPEKVKRPGAAADLTMASFDDKTRAKVAETWADVADGDTLEDMDRHLRQVFDAAMLDPDSVAEGKRWYSDAGKEASKLAKKHGVDKKHTVGVIAALSPGGEWETNKKQADEMLTFAKKHPDLSPEELAYAARKHYKWSVAYGMGNYIKAAEIARGGDPDVHLQGSKVRSFYNNISRPKDGRDVTIDTHMLNAAYGGLERKGASGVFLDIKKPKIKIGEDAKGNAIFESAPSDWQPVQVPGAPYKGRKSASSTLTGTPKSAGRTVGVTPAVADSIRTIAAERGLLPQQVQAIIWIHQRKLHPPSEAREASKKIQALTFAKYFPNGTPVLDEE